MLSKVYNFVSTTFSFQSFPSLLDLILTNYVFITQYQSTVSKYYKNINNEMQTYTSSEWSGGRVSDV